MDNPPIDPVPSSVAPGPLETPAWESVPDPLKSPAVSFRPGAGLRAFAVGVFYLVFWQIALAIPSGDIYVVGTTTIFSLFIVLAFTVLVARSLLTRRAIVLNLLAAGTLALPLILVPILIRMFPWLAAWHRLSPVLMLYFHSVHLLPGIDELILIWFAAAMGAGIARLVREFKMLLPMALALAIVDLYVVFGGGLVTQANAGHSPVASAAMRALTVELPTTSSKLGAASMKLSVGLADFLFTSLFFACFARFGIPSRRTFLTLFVTLVVYMFIVFFLNLDLPALVPIAVVVIGMNLTRFRFSRSEVFAMLYAGLLVLGILGLMKRFAQ